MGRSFHGEDGPDNGAVQRLNRLRSAHVETGHQGTSDQVEGSGSETKEMRHSSNSTNLVTENSTINFIMKIVILHLFCHFLLSSIWW